MQNERKKLERRREKLNFFWKKTIEIFIRFLSWGNSFGSLEAGGEKNESDGPEALESSSSPRLLAVFAEENSWSRSLKKAQKNECVVVSSFI